MRNYLNYAHRLIELPAHCDSRGTLVSVESIDDVPFPIKRLYYIYGVDSAVRRGFHAHKNLEQVLVCVSGSCKVHVDDGTEQKDYDLSNPEVGLYLSNFVWREMYDFSENAVLLVLASEHYDEEDYIRNYNEFCKFFEVNK